MEVCHEHVIAFSPGMPCPACSLDETISDNKKREMRDWEEFHKLVDAHIQTDKTLGIHDKVDLLIKELVEIKAELVALKAEKPATQPKYKPGDTVVIDKSKAMPDGLYKRLPSNCVITLQLDTSKQYPWGLGWYDLNTCKVWPIELCWIKCLAPEQEDKERVWWTDQDYAEMQIQWLKFGEDDLWRITGMYEFNMVMRRDCVIRSKSYEQIAKDCTLPDGTELYKEQVGSSE